METSPETKTRRGFALMTPDRLKEVARRGGQAVQSKGTAHRFTSEEARAARAARRAKTTENGG